MIARARRGAPDIIEGTAGPLFRPSALPVRTHAGGRDLKGAVFRHDPGQLRREPGGNRAPYAGAKPPFVLPQNGRGREGTRADQEGDREAWTGGAGGRYLNEMMSWVLVWALDLVEG